MKFNAYCTQDQFEELIAAVDKARRTSKNIVVNREALSNLLMDHGNLWKIVEKLP